MSESPQPLVLTLKIDQVTFSRFDQLRQNYFPPKKNYLPAHLTLFHALPGDHQTAVQRKLQELCSTTRCMSLNFPKLRFLGKVVAIEVECAELNQLHQQLAEAWHPWLSRQDQQKFRPHITIQNKTTSEQARQLYEQLAREWKSFAGCGEGLLLWRYIGGPWEFIGDFAFKAAIN